MAANKKQDGLLRCARNDEESGCTFVLATRSARAVDKSLAPQRAWGTPAGSFATVASGYVLSKPGWADLESRNFERAIKRQFWRRLKWIVRKSVLAFQSYNSGFTRIDGVDDIGILRWCLTGAGVCNVVQKHAN